MKKLPIYPVTPQAVISTTTPRPIDHDCELCIFSLDAKTICMSPEGEAGGLLVVGDYPGREEDRIGRPLAGPSGNYTRTLIQKYWKRPIAYDNAIKCAPPYGADIKDKQLDACREYLATVLRDTQPSRIIALGSDATYSLLGRRVYPLHARRGYGWVTRSDGVMTPVFYVINPSFATRNRFVGMAFESDMKWALTCTTPKPKYSGITNLVVTDQDARLASASIRTRGGQEKIVYDVETSGRMGNSDFRIEACTVLEVSAKESFTWTREALRDPTAKRYLKEVLEQNEVVGQHVKYDDRSVLTYLGADANSVADTRLFRKLLDFEAPASLEVMAELVGMGGHKEEAQVRIAAICKELAYQADPPSGSTPTGRVRKVNPPAFPISAGVLKQVHNGTHPMGYAYRFLEPDVLYRYNARDVFSTRAVYKKLAKQLDAEPQIKRVWDLVVKDASKAIRWIEHWGFAVDKSAMNNFAQYCTGRETLALLKIQKAGIANPASPIQLRDFLFKRLGLRSAIQTNSGLQSTAADVLETLVGQHPIIETLMEYRKFQKLNGTYATGLLPHIREDGRIHASYLLDGAGTGRLSSAEPNMQNIPRAKGNAEGKMLRECFIAPQDYVLIEADQSQVELRIAAMLSGDKVMIDDYKQGIDIHANNARECCEVAWKISKAKWDSMTKAERDPYRTQIKTSTFGRLYGKSDRGLAKEFGVDVKVIEAINAKIWGRYRRLAAWIQERVSYSRKTGITWTWWDGQDARRRQIWGIGDPDEGKREHAERTAYNSTIQGTAADFTTASLWPLVQWILEEQVPVKVVATVHDSIIVEAHKSMIEETVFHMNRIMTGWPTAGGMPLVAEFKIGPNWGSMEEHKL